MIDSTILLTYTSKPSVVIRVKTGITHRRARVCIRSTITFFPLQIFTPNKSKEFLKILHNRDSLHKDLFHICCASVSYTLDSNTSKRHIIYDSQLPPSRRQVRFPDRADCSLRGVDRARSGMKMSGMKANPYTYRSLVLGSF